MVSSWKGNLGEHDKPETQGRQNHIYTPKERHISQMGVNTKKSFLGTSLLSQIRDSGNLYPLSQSPMKTHHVRAIHVRAPVYHRVHYGPKERDWTESTFVLWKAGITLCKVRGKDCPLLWCQRVSEEKVIYILVHICLFFQMTENWE